MSIHQPAFTLPTVVIASIIMLTALLLSLQMIASSSAGLRNIYHDQLAKTAAEAGLIRAQECLKQNNYVAAWSDASPLQPWTNCAGVGSRSSCENTSRCYVMFHDNIRSFYTVNYPDSSGGQGSQVISAVGSVNLLRQSTNVVYQTHDVTTKGRAGSIIGVEGVYFGYLAWGADLRPFYLTKTTNGGLKGAGYNGSGQLSLGHQGSITEPADYLGLPSNVSVSEVFTQFKSGDLTTFILMSDGRLFASGDNSLGNLGLNPSTQQYVNIARHYNIGTPVKAAFNAGYKTYVVSTNGALYATGKCNELGLPSYNDGGGNCWNPRLVQNLPAASASNPATRVKSVVADGAHNYLIMEGGQLYGWDSSGSNLCGLLGSNSRTPLRIGNFGDAGQPKVVKIDTDGIGLFALLDNGRLLSGGCSHGGHLASTETAVRTHNDPGTPRCIDIEWGNPNNGRPVQYWNCTGGNAQHWAFDEDYKIRNGNILPGTSRCLDLRAGNQSNGTPVQIWDCQASNPNQEWIYWSDESIRLRANTNKCLSAQSVPVNSGVDIVLWDCDGNAWQKWNFAPIAGLKPVNLQSGWRVLDVATDFASVLMLVDTNNDGTGDRVYGAGKNHVGQLGAGSGPGTVQNFHPRVAQFILPTSGSTAVRPVSLFHTAHGDLSSNTLVVTERISNPTIREVFGAGSNSHGQLGLGYTSATEPTPRKMSMIENAASAKTGGNMSLVAATDGLVYTVGRNHYGQLGDGTTVDSAVPRIRRYINPLPLIMY